MSAAKQRSSKKAAEDVNPDFALPGIGNYVFVKTLGEGNFAKVKLAKHKLTELEVAIKVIDKTQLDEKKISKLYREVRIMKLLHHPHIVRLYEVIETKSTVFLVMEYSSGGELYDYLVVHGRMKEKEARAKFRQILSAVSYCHKKRVIHRDLKAENLLLDENLDIKIADFGFSNLYDPDAKLDTFCGSPPYAAPELFQGRRYTGPEVDVWSLGVILYVLTTGCLPFDGKTLQEMRESVCRGKYRIPFYLSDSCEKLLRKFLIRDPYKRASLDILIDDPWINEGYPDSPIVSDLALKPVTEDESLIKVMETKFHIDRNTVLKALREGIYDDVAAIYYLLYHERDQKGGDLGAVGPATIKIVQPPPQAGSTAGPKKESDMVPIDEDDVLPHTPTNITKSAPRSVETSGEQVPVASAAAAGTGVTPRTTLRANAVPRRRRFTVGGEADMQKLADDEDGREAAAALKLLQEQPNGAKKDKDAPSSTAASALAVPAIPRVHGAAGEVQSGSTGATSTSSSGAAGSSPDKTAQDAATPPGSGEGGVDDSGEPTGRKRHNTIVGLFRNTLRKSGDAASGDVPGSPTMGPGVVPTTATVVSSAQDKAAVSVVDASGVTKPRSLRFTFNSNTTSSKPPDDVVAEVVAAATKHGMQHRLAGRYLIECTVPLQGPPAPGRENVKFEIEICKLPRLRNLHGLRFKRISGTSADYKDACEKLLETVAL